MKRKLAVALLAVSLAGCAAYGNKSLNDNPQKLAAASDEALCAAWTTSSDGEFPNIDAEATRRGLDCKNHPGGYYGCAAGNMSVVGMVVNSARRRCP